MAENNASLDTGHDYDGIRELDNVLPNWWLLTLFGAVVFSYGYWFYYHVFDGTPGSVATWQAEEAEAAKKVGAAKPVSDDVILALSKDKDVLEKANGIFTSQCAACHNPDGSGKLGPNLTDKFWLHGGKPTDIYATISDGVPAKGMLAWKGVLGEEKVRWMAAYVTTLKGKDLPGKAPEGQPE